MSRPLANFIVHLSLGLAWKAAASVVYLEDVIVTESGGANPFNDAIIKEPTTVIGGAISSREFVAASQTQVAVPAEGEEVPLDILVSGRNYFTYTLFRWPNGRVPYTIDATFSPKERLIIAQALSELEEKSCIKFADKKGSDQDFVHIYTSGGSGCFANDHYRKGLGQHGIHLARPGCMYRHVIVHELMHLLGVGHEHQRPDRDNFVTINWDNIQSGTAYNFFKDMWDTSLATPNLCYNWRNIRDYSECSSGLVRKDYGLGYDYESVMHYQSKFFAVDKTVQTIVSKDPNITEFGGVKMTKKDEEKLKAAYGCSGCGGSHVGGGGEITFGNHDTDCEWLITVDDGSVIELSIKEFSIPKCGEGNLTIYEGYKQLGEKTGEFCGSERPLWRLVSRTNSVTLHIKKTSDEFIQFSATWKKQPSACCESILISNTNLASSPLLQYPQNPLDIFMGLYRQAGEVNGGPVYRRVGNLNMWLARFVPLSSFTKAAWMISDDLKGVPGRKSPEGPGLYFGGNVKCPELAWKTYVDTPDSENRKRTDINGIRITCYQENIHEVTEQLWGVPSPVSFAFPVLG